MRLAAACAFGVMGILMLFRADRTVNGLSTQESRLVFATIELCIFLAALFQFVYAMRLRASATIHRNGITIYTRPNRMLCTIPWSSVCRCAYLPAGSLHKPPYMMVITSFSALIDGKSAFLQETALPEKVAKKYRMDEAMERLARGEMTQAEFDQQGVYLLAVTKKEFQAVAHIREKRRIL